MINVDLRNAFPHTAFVYLVALIPGAFFELSILFGNPELACQVLARSQEVFSLDRWALFAIFLLIAFLVGTALMLLVSLIQFALRSLYSYLIVPARHIIRRQVYLPVLRRMLFQQGVPQPGWTLRQVRELFDPYHQRLQNQVNNENAQMPSVAFLWWVALAKQLLLKKCGLPDDKFPTNNFDPLVYALATPTGRDLRGDLIMIMSQATGWAAFVARRFAPALHTRWYTTFAVFLIFTGIVHDWYLAKRLTDPDFLFILFLRNLLRQFPKLTPDSVTRPDGTPPKPGAVEDDQI